MFASSGKLSRKIVGILLVFFLVATAAIVMTLIISWQLEGVAAAINDAGSQRMRTYRIGHLMSRGLDPAYGQAAIRQSLPGEIARFEAVLRDLRSGDPERPLSPPRNAEVQARLNEVAETWRGSLQPLIIAYLAADPASRHALVERYDRELEPFVRQINELVLVMEQSFARDTNGLRTVQGLLILLAIIGTVILIRFFTHLVIRPVKLLHDGMREMTANNLGARVPVESDNELGGLARGFNQMAEHLQTVHSTLEERVEEETRSLAQRNRELGILYEATAMLSEPAQLDTLCHSFLDRIKTALGADGGAVRLYMPDTQKLYLVSHQGLSQRFLESERELDCGECLCGEVIQSGLSAVFDTVNPPEGMKFGNCIREGFATSTAFSIVHGKQRLGVYNLYFLKARALPAQEIHLLETLGQHLGVAIENHRLKSREMELAVSEERNLLAQELHDSIAQGLAFLNIQVQLLQDSLSKQRLDEAAQTAGSLREGVQESYDHVRELLVHFRSRVLHADLETAIASSLEKFEGQTGIRTGFQKAGNGPPLAPTDEIQILHIIQESLSNIRKHAQASRVLVSLTRQHSAVEIVVQDDGIGFDPVNEPKIQSDRHVGLKIMRERAHRIGGECQIAAKSGEGTRVTLTLPNPGAEGQGNE